MSKKTVIFNVGGTTFEIKKDSFDAYPNSSLYKLVNRSSSSSSFSSRFSSNKSSTQTIFLDHNPFAFSVILDYIRYKRLCIPKNVTREIVELQLREFGLGDDIKLSDKSSSEIEDDLPSYEQALNGFSASDGIALKDAAMLAVFRRIDTLISDVILPYLNRHAKRGHQQVTFYLTPNIITKNITTELEHINDPHEWVQLSTSSSSVDKDDSLKNDLPDLQFLLQKRETLDQLRDLIINLLHPKSEIEKKCT
ncbi:BTB/POZ domain-containing protein KCTD5 [Rhizophagus clarus]|uniref:BTB/POZ domain-containing protein KCTD5 n=1 Tax=Rhizophagus clarus TaxID=94130 RepID=A0A8H3LT38_9GLOM|nr:BTB/POZ domain-containing protein KCTD5 [Rhizophagus clarus]